MSKLILTKDINGVNTFGMSFSTQKSATTLLEDEEQTLTAPTNSTSGYLAVFSYEPGAKVWVALGATATVPGAAFAATDSEQNPVARNVPSGGILHFITNDTSAEVGVVFYELS